MTLKVWSHEIARPVTLFISLLYTYCLFEESLKKMQLIWSLLRKEYNMLSWNCLTERFSSSSIFVSCSVVYLATPAELCYLSTQGRNEVYFFVADPVFLRKFLIPDPKSDENFDPWSHKILLIPVYFLSITLSGNHFLPIRQCDIRLK